MAMAFATHLLCAEPDSTPLAKPLLWTAPDISLPVTVQVQGKVETIRSSIVEMRPGSPDAMTVWKCPDGMKAHMGDALFRMDTTTLQNDYFTLLDDFASKRMLLERARLEGEKELFQMKEDLALELMVLGVARSTAAAAVAADDSETEISRQQIGVAKRNVDVQAAELSRKRTLLALGQETRIRIEDLELALSAARREIRVRELALEEIGDGSDRVVARRALWDVTRLEAAFGDGADFETLEDTLENNEIVDFQTTLAGDLESIRGGLLAVEAELQELARGSWPHVPLQKLTIANATGVVRTLSLNAPRATELYSKKQGAGWITAPSIYPSSQALVVQGMAAWQCDLPPGEYTLTFMIGDTDEWGCMLVKAAEQVVVALHRLEPEQIETLSAKVHVGKDGLRLNFGLPQKSIIAPVECTVKNQSWNRLGQRIRRNSPALYIIPDPKLVVKSRVHHLQVPFFEGATGVDLQIELRDSNGTWVPAGKVSVGDQPIPFFEDEDESTSHRRSRRRPRSSDGDGETDPAARTAREVSITVPKEYRNGFVSESHVDARVTASPRSNTIVVPAHLVHQGEDGLNVQEAGATVRVTGTRLDEHVFVTAGLTTGATLEIPTVDTVNEDADRFTGGVIAGATTPILARHDSWARVETMLPHGSAVKKGDLVMQIFRNKQADQYRKADSSAAQSIAKYKKSVARRKATFDKHKKTHADAVYKEKLAADRVAEHRRRDLAVLASAKDKKQETAEQLELVSTRVQALSGLDSSRLEHDSYSRQQDILLLKTKQHSLNEVATYRNSDYTAQLQDRMNWGQARKTLTRREAGIALNLKQQALQSQQARSVLERGVEQNMLSKDFERNRRLYAPVDGHVFYGHGYNDLMKRMGRLDIDFVVWQGLKIADVLDLSNLSLKVSLPERFYDSLHLDLELPIELEDLEGRSVLGRVIDKGRVLYSPSDSEDAENGVISVSRNFDVVLAFSVPEDLVGRIKPGLRGSVTVK